MRKRQKHDKMSLLECFRLNYRGYQIWRQREPELFLCLFACAVIGAVTPYITIYFSAQIIHELSGTRNPSRLLHLVILTLAATTLLAILNAILNRWKNSRQAGVYYKRQKIYADKLFDMDFCDVDKQNTHRLLAQIDQYEKWSGWGMGRIFSYFEIGLQSIVSIITAFVLTFHLFTSQVPETAGKIVVINNPLFSVLVIALFMLVTILTPVCRNQAKKYWFRNTESTNLGNRIFSFFSYMGQEHSRAMDIRIYQQQNIGDCYLDKEKSLSADSQIARYARGPMGLWNVAGAVMNTVFTGMIYLFVCIKSWAGAFGVGAVTQYIGAIATLSQGVAKLVETAGDMRNNAVFLKTTFEFLDIPNQMCQGDREVSQQNPVEIEFCDVSFQYPDSEVYALRHVSLKIEEGKRMAVVGMNGSGKSTFIKLLCRLYDPTEGKILLNGIDIKQYDYESYRALFSVIFQDFKLLSFPLGENVAAKADYNEKLVEECLTKAGFKPKFDQLPQAAKTYLGREFDREGIEMSGGEAQKIAIARALYRNAPIMILDEPTSALDPVTEMEIYQKFDEITGDKSVIYISHRLSSCRFCDEILVFHEGKLIQRGNHDTLVQNTGGKYYELWQAQAQYYR